MPSIHDFVVDQLNARKGEWPTVSKDSGIPYGTLKKIATRVSVAPRIDNLEKLAAYFRAQHVGARRAELRVS